MAIWQKRFSEKAAQELLQFTQSLDQDRRMAVYDILGTRAHVKVLCHAGIVSPAERKKINAALRSIERQIKKDEFCFLLDLEDVHMNIESDLIRRLGDLGKKVHTGRSRNDQVLTDLKLYLKDAVPALINTIRGLQKSFVKQAEKGVDTVIPGWTHLQIAQPISVGSYCLAYFWMLDRDIGRLTSALTRMDKCPLGAAALAGTTLPLDRNLSAAELGFSGPSENSLDTVASRDFVSEIIFCCSQLMINLSRFCEEMVLFSSQPLDLVSLPGAYCTGSSIMPQKQNPDVCELIRGRAGSVMGDLTAIMALQKNLPMAYNRDLQEDKKHLFSSLDITMASTHILQAIVKGLKWSQANALRLLQSGHITATDLAEYLVEKGLPFRDSYYLVQEIVRYADDRDIQMVEIPLAQLKRFSDRISGDVFDALDPVRAMSRRNVVGGVGQKPVRDQIRAAKKILKK